MPRQIVAHNGEHLITFADPVDGPGGYRYLVQAIALSASAADDVRSALDAWDENA